jgi:hypothetical protein
VERCRHLPRPHGQSALTILVPVQLKGPRVAGPEGLAGLLDPTWNLHSLAEPLHYHLVARYPRSISDSQLVGSIINEPVHLKGRDDGMRIQRGTAHGNPARTCVGQNLEPGSALIAARTATVVP